MELSLLCDCEIALIIFEGPPQNKVIEYGSKSIDETLKLFATNGSPNQAVTNEDYKRMFGSKKGKPRARRAASSVSASKAVASTNAASSEGETKLYKFTNDQLIQGARSSIHATSSGGETKIYRFEDGKLGQRATLHVHAVDSGVIMKLLKPRNGQSNAGPTLPLMPQQGSRGYFRAPQSLSDYSYLQKYPSSPFVENSDATNEGAMGGISGE